MNKNTTPDQNAALISHLGRLTAEEFCKTSGYVLGHQADGTPNPWPVDWHIETLPYYPVLDALAVHVGDCRQCFEDGDGPTTCEDALILEHAGQYEVNQQFITSLLN